VILGDFLVELESHSGGFLPAEFFELLVAFSD
jgi:hypothetical protein